MLCAYKNLKMMYHDKITYDLCIYMDRCLYMMLPTCYLQLHTEFGKAGLI